LVRVFHVFDRASNPALFAIRVARGAPRPTRSRRGSRTCSRSVTINNSHPVELTSLTESLQSLTAAHARFADARGVSINGDAVRLYVREIKTGSIIVDLIALATNGALFPDQLTTIVDFAKTVVETVRFFKGERDTGPEGLKSRDAADISKFLGPVANDSRSTLNINAGEGSSVTVNYDITSNDANAVQNRAAHWIARNAEPLTGIQRGQLFYFFQARDDRHATTGDRGVIEAISNVPVKTIFANEEAKAAMLDEALFRKLYIVDVYVQTW
jgi:hypothetical protein